MIYNKSLKHLNVAGTSLGHEARFVSCFSAGKSCEVGVLGMFWRVWILIMRQMKGCYWSQSYLPPFCYRNPFLQKLSGPFSQKATTFFCTNKHVELEGSVVPCSIAKCSFQDSSFCSVQTLQSQGSCNKFLRFEALSPKHETQEATKKKRNPINPRPKTLNPKPLKENLGLKP